MHPLIHPQYLLTQTLFQVHECEKSELMCVWLHIFVIFSPGFKYMLMQQISLHNTESTRHCHLVWEVGEYNGHLSTSSSIVYSKIDSSSVGRANRKNAVFFIARCKSFYAHCTKQNTDVLGLFLIYLPALKFNDILTTQQYTNLQ